MRPGSGRVFQPQVVRYLPAADVSSNLTISGLEWPSFALQGLAGRLGPKKTPPTRARVRFASHPITVPKVRQLQQVTQLPFGGGGFGTSQDAQNPFGGSGHGTGGGGGDPGRRRI